MKKITILLLAVAFSTMLSAQKFGYVNSQELLVSLPEIKSADTELETLQTVLMTKGKVMVDSFETEYKAYVEKANGGLLSKIQMQTQEEALTKKQQAIQGYEQEIQTLIGQKREQLYKPILDKVTNAIKTYGKDNGYSMIFDTSAGLLLYSIEGDNLMEGIMTKLGTVATTTSPATTAPTTAPVKKN